MWCGEESVSARDGEFPYPAKCALQSRSTSNLALHSIKTKQSNIGKSYVKNAGFNALHSSYKIVKDWIKRSHRKRLFHFLPKIYMYAIFFSK